MAIDLFSSGKIFLVKKPVNGNAGIPSLYAKFLNGSFGVENIQQDEDVYVIFSNANRKLLIILHIDEAGVAIYKRRLFSGKFKIMLDNAADPCSLTRESLKRLILDGTYEGDWQSIYQKKKVKKVKTA